MLMQLNEVTATLRRMYLILVDATDGYSLETGISSPTIEVTKNGGSQTSGTGTFTEIGDGEYYYEFNSGEVDTLGFLAVRILGTGCREVKLMVQIVAFDPYAVANLGLTDLTAIKAKTDNLNFDGNNVLADVMALNTGVITSGVFTADAISSSAFSQGAADKVWGTATRTITGGTVTTATNVTNVNDKTGYSISGTITTLDALDTALDTAHGASSWLTATGFSTHVATDIWSVATRTITGGTVDTATSVTNDVGITQTGADKVWSTTVRTITGGVLTTPADYKADVSALATEANATTNTSNIQTNINANETKIDTVITDIGNLNNITAISVWAVGTRQLSGTISDFDELDTALDLAHGASSWLTGGGGSGISIQTIPSIPKNIDLADTKTVRIALYVNDQSDDLPTVAEITPGTITIDKSADGGTSWTTIRNAIACSEHSGAIYYDEVFSSGNGYASADMIRIIFKGQIVTIDANDFVITDSTNGMVFITRMDSGLSGGGPSAGDIADAVWEEATADHDTSTTFGGKNQKVVPSETIADYRATGFSTHNATDVWSVGTKIITGGVLTTPNDYKATGFSVPNEYDTVIAALQTDLDNPNQYKADVSNLDQAISTTESNIRGGTETLESLNTTITGLNNLSSSDVQTVLETNDLDHIAKVSYGASKPTVGSLFDKIMNKDGSQTHDPTTDSQEALRDNQGAGGTTPQAVWEYATGGGRTLSVPGDYKATGYATSSALATHDGKLDTVDGVVDSIKSKTDNIPNDIDTLLRDIAGLLGKHQYIDNYLFTSGMLESCRIRIYNSKANAESHGVTGLLSTWTVTVTWDGTDLESYLVVKE